MRHFALDDGIRLMPAPPTLRSTVFRDRTHSHAIRRVPFERLLLEHCERILASARGRKLVVHLDLKFEGACPGSHETTVLRAADELLSNSLEHGLYHRQRGRVFVHVICRVATGVQVSVSDDGWGFDGGRIIDGNGFLLLRQLGALHLAAPPGPFVANAAVTLVIPLQRHGQVSTSPGDVVVRQPPCGRCP